MRLIRLVCGGIVGVVVSTAGARAQTLAGITREAATGAPVPGVVVSLLDAASTLTARTISDRDGKFTLTVTAAARALQARRIGFRPLDRPIPDSAHTSPVTVDVALQQVPQTLDPVPVSARRCADPSKTAPQAAALWEQARAGFLATVAARDALPATLSDLAFSLEAPDKTVTYGRNGTTTTSTVTGPASVTTVLSATVEQRVANRPWVAGRSPELFVSRGYLELEGDYPHLYGPDADVLLDPSFEATHCFSVIDHDATHAGEVGVAFQPVLGRDTLADIRGVLWMNQAPLALRALEFTYVGRNAADNDRSGGRLSFGTADNGVVLVDEWSLHYPAKGKAMTAIGVSRATDGHLTSTPISTVDRQRLQMIGGSLLGAKWPDGTTLTRTLPSIRGTVTDSVTSAPIGGAVVTLTRDGYLVQTGVDGGYAFSPLMPGRYSVTATDLAWARYGVQRAKSITVDAFGGATLAAAAAPIRLGPPLAFARPACARASLDKGKGMVGLRLIDTAGAPASAPVVFSFVDANGRNKADKQFPVNGRVVVCGLGAGTVTMTAADPAGRSGRLELRPTGAERVDTVTLVLRNGGTRR